MYNEFQYRLLQESSADLQRMKKFAEESAKALHKQYPYLYPYRIGGSSADTESSGFIEYPKLNRTIEFLLDEYDNFVIKTYTKRKLEFKSKPKPMNVKTVLAYMKMVEGESGQVTEGKMKDMYTELQLSLEEEMPRLSSKDIDKIINIAWKVWSEYV